MKEYDPICQVDEIKNFPADHTVWDEIWLGMKQSLRRLKRAGMLLFQGIRKLRRSTLKTEPMKQAQQEVALRLQPGERVRVRPAEEIRKTLDEEGKFRGTLFTRDMWQYCGREMVVFKRVNMFLDERTNKIRKIRNTVLLKDAYCSGERAFGERCDRSCFLFWKEIWLERVED